MKYQPPINSTSPDASYIDGTEEVKGSIVPAKAVEDPQRELVNIIQAAGISPSENQKDQLTKAVKSLSIEYDPTVDYNSPVLVLGSNGLLYLWMKRNGPLSTLMDPVLDGNQEYWKPLLVIISNASTQLATNLVYGLTRLSDTSDRRYGALNSVAVTPKALDMAEQATAELQDIVITLIKTVYTFKADIIKMIEKIFYADIDNPERTVLCRDKQWRHIEDIPFN